jgi:hypothetical protein
MMRTYQINCIFKESYAMCVTENLEPTLFHFNLLSLRKFKVLGTQPAAAQKYQQAKYSHRNEHEG